MRRFGFYILIALLTFGIGSFIAFKFYRKSDENPANNDLIQTKARLEAGEVIGQSRTTERNKQVSSENNKRPEASCKDEKILPVWNELKKDEIFKVFEEVFYMNADCRAMLEVKEIDLNKDGEKEIILRGSNGNLCSGTGNCGFWIFEKEADKYKKLLSNYDNDETGISNQIKEVSTKNYRDIFLKGHITADKTSYAFYKFDGRKYKADKCLVEVYQITGEKEILSCKKYNTQQEENTEAKKEILKKQNH